MANMQQIGYGNFIVFPSFNIQSNCNGSLGPWKFVLDMGSLSHRGLIIAPGQEADRDNKVQSTLVISNSLISKYRLSRSENLVPVLTQRSTNRQQNIVEKRRNCSLGAISPLFHNVFNITLT